MIQLVVHNYRPQWSTVEGRINAVLSAAILALVFKGVL